MRARAEEGLAAQMLGTVRKTWSDRFLSDEALRSAGVPSVADPCPTIEECRQVAGEYVNKVMRLAREKEALKEARRQEWVDAGRPEVWRHED